MYVHDPSRSGGSGGASKEKSKTLAALKKTLATYESLLSTFPTLFADFDEGGMIASTMAALRNISRWIMRGNIEEAMEMLQVYIVRMEEEAESGNPDILILMDVVNAIMDYLFERMSAAGRVDELSTSAVYIEYATLHTAYEQLGVSTSMLIAAMASGEDRAEVLKQVGLMVLSYFQLTMTDESASEILTVLAQIIGVLPTLASGTTTNGLPELMDLTEWFARISHLLDVYFAENAENAGLISSFVTLLYDKLSEIFEQNITNTQVIAVISQTMEFVGRHVRRLGTGTSRTARAAALSANIMSMGF